MLAIDRQPQPLVSVAASRTPAVFGSLPAGASHWKIRTWGVFGEHWWCLLESAHHRGPYWKGVVFYSQAKTSLALPERGARMAETEAFPDMATGYARYRGLFFDALARLARQGFAVQHADGLNLIHDFFAESWDGLAARYHPALGAAPNYIYGAFVRFARKRIIRLQRWRQPLQDMALLADDISAQATISPLESLVEGEEAKLMQQALRELPSRQRMVLLDYFASGPRSQRQLARKYQMSRYQLHELLISAYGQLVIGLGDHGAWPVPDREVATALWCDGRTVEETAARLGRSIDQVRETRKRLTKLLATALVNGRVPVAGSSDIEDAPS